MGCGDTLEPPSFTNIGAGCKGGIHVIVMYYDIVIIKLSVQLYLFNFSMQLSDTELCTRPSDLKFQHNLRNVTSTLDHVLTASLPRSKNSRTWRGRGQIETISDF